MEHNQLTTKDMIYKLILLFWLIGFCVVMSLPIWLNYLFGTSIGIGLMCLAFGFAIWMMVLVVLIT